MKIIKKIHGLLRKSKCFSSGNNELEIRIGSYKQFSSLILANNNEIDQLWYQNDYLIIWCNSNIRVNMPKRPWLSIKSRFHFHLLIFYLFFWFNNQPDSIFSATLIKKVIPSKTQLNYLFLELALKPIKAKPYSCRSHSQHPLNHY